MISYKLPKIDANQVVILDTPVAGDTNLATGILTIKDEAGNDALIVKTSDLLSFSYDAYSAGTANVVEVTLTNVAMVANSVYALTVNAPYVKNFFQGGKETGATYQTRTYTVGVDATPTVDELGALFAARINADANAYFSATYSSGSDILTITAASAEAGALVVTAPYGATIVDDVPWVSPAGTTAEVASYVTNASLINAAGYERFYITYRKAIRHNAVQGLQVIKPVTSIVYIDKDDAGAGAAVILLYSILDGTYATVADYLGCPEV